MEFHNRRCKFRLYEYQYSTDEFFTTYMGSTTQSSSISIGVLDYNTEYFWRIKATDGTNFSEWSEIWSFTTEDNVSVNDIEKTSIVLYPNPVNNILNISSEEKIELISIYNITGKIIFEEKNSNNDYNINTSIFKNGIYLIKIKLNNKTLIKRFIVKH